MPIAPIVGAAIITAAGVVIGAVENSSATKDAAQAQAQSAQNALDFQEGAYNTRLSQLAPTVETGQAADAQLAQRLGLPAPPPYVPAQPVPITGQPAPSSGAGTSSTTSGSTPPPVAAPAPVPAATPSPTPAPTSGVNFSSMNGPSPANGSADAGLVTMRAPNGETQQVPLGLVTYYQGLGATPVQSGTVV